jgi:hypothetical protein
MKDITLEIVKGFCCEKCILNGLKKGICCVRFTDITGINCYTDGYILKKKSRWVKCTKDNTKKGDTVRCEFLKEKREISYVFKGETNKAHNCVVYSSNIDREYASWLYHYEIEI